MVSKKDIELQAKSLMESSPDEAVLLYRKLWDEFNGEFNAWDAFFTLKALRRTEKPDINFAFQITEKYRDNEKVQGLLGWLVFDKCVKNLARTELLQNEKHLHRLVSIVSQKNSREDLSYPCPVTISIFKLIDAYTENLFNSKKVYEWVEKLNPELLSITSKTITTNERGEVKLAPDIEKYYAHMTKALIKLERFDECKSLCEKALNDLSQFHFNNDLWFKMRIAICCEKLGSLEESEQLFRELLSTKAGSDKWFLYREIAELYFDQKNFNKAWQFAVDSFFHGNEPHYMIGLYLLQARVLVKLGRPEEGKILAQLIASILKDQGWKNKAEYDKLFKFYGIEFKTIAETKSYFEDVKRFLASERYKNKPTKPGIIVSVHRNGKVGRIKDCDGNLYGFHKKDFLEKQKNIDGLIGATLEFIQMESFDGIPVAEHIKILKLPEKHQDAELEGKVLNGTVKKIVEFGVFVCFQGMRDGLLHRNNLPRDLKDIFQKRFEVGQKVQVKVLKVSSKGLELSMDGIW